MFLYARCTSIPVIKTVTMLDFFGAFLLRFDGELQVWISKLNWSPFTLITKIYYHVHQLTYNYMPDYLNYYHTIAWTAKYTLYYNYWLNTSLFCYNISYRTYSFTDYKINFGCPNLTTLFPWQLIQYSNPNQFKFQNTIGSRFGLMLIVSYDFLKKMDKIWFDDFLLFGCLCSLENL